jgi:hypothetical protein
MVVKCRLDSFQITIAEPDAFVHCSYTRELDSARAELKSVRNSMYVSMTVAIVFLATTLYFAIRKPKKKTVTS